MAGKPARLLPPPHTVYCTPMDPHAAVSLARSVNWLGHRLHVLRVRVQLSGQADTVPIHGVRLWGPTTLPSDGNQGFIVGG
jgi:hypothetical protein